MTLEIYSTFYRHPDGKEYFLALIRESTDMSGPCYVVKNWGKTVSTEFSVGQIQALYYDDYWQASAAFGKENEHRLSPSKGYEKITDLDWREVTERQLDNLVARSTFDDSLLTGGGQTQGQTNPGMKTVQHPDGTRTVTYANGSEITYDQNGNAVQAGKKPAADPNAVPGPRTGGTKRLEWVMAHTDHPQALEQMMQVAQQMTTERDKAATTVAAIDNDLSFVNAWLQQRLASLVR